MRAQPVSLTLEDMRELLVDASPETLAQLERIAATRALAPREALVRQGEDLGICVVLDGWLAVRRTSPEGRTYTLVILRPGDIVGLPAAWRSTQSMFDIVALTSANVAGLPGPALRNMAERDPSLAIRLFDLAMNASMEFAERLDWANFDIARKRLAKILLIYEPLLSGSPPILSRADLAGLIETSREMLGNAIRTLESERVIRREGRRIVVVDRPTLEAEAELVGAAEEQDRWLSAVGTPWVGILAS